MPCVNIYCKKELVHLIEKELFSLRAFIAKELSCNDRMLREDEVSIRIIVPEAALSIAEVEVVIIAHAYQERIEKQDIICKAVQQFMHHHSVHVWLQLNELGHSF